MANGKLEIEGLKELLDLVLKFQDEISKSADAVAAIIKAQDVLNKTNLQNAKTLTELNKASAVQTKEENDSAIAKQKLAKETSNAQKAEVQYIQAKQKASGASKEATSLYEKELNELKRLKAAGREAGLAYGVNSAEAKKAAKAHNELYDKMNNVNKSLGDGKMQVGIYHRAMQNLPGSLGSAADGMKMLGQQMWNLVKNPVGLIITAIAGAMYGLYLIFSKFEPIVELVERKIAALGAVLSVIGDTIVAVFTGQVKLKDATKGLGDAMVDAAKKGEAYRRMMQENEDAAIRLTANEAKYKRQIDELLLQSKNRTLSEKERIALIDQALDIEKKAYTEKSTLVESEYQTMIKQYEAKHGLTEAEVKDINERGVLALQDLQLKKRITDDEVRTFAEAYAKREQVLNESIAIEEKAMNRRDVLVEKAETERKKQIEDDKKFQEDKAKFVESLETNATAKLEAEYAKRLEQAKKFDVDSLEIDLWYKEEQAKIDEDNRKNELEKKIEHLELEAVERDTIMAETYKNELELANGNTDAIQLANSTANEAMYQSDLKYLTDKMILYKLGTDEQIKIENQITQLQLKHTQDVSDAKSKAFEEQKKKDEIAVTEEKKRIEQKTAFLVKLVEDTAEITGRVTDRLLSDNKYKIKDALKDTLKMTVRAIITAFKASLQAQQITAMITSVANGKNIVAGLIDGALKIIAINIIASGADALISRAIDKFEKGTNDAPGGLAIVGEKGRELMILPTGERFLTPPVDTMMNIPEHTKIIPNHLVENELYKSIQGSKSEKDISFAYLLNDIKGELQKANKRELLSVHVNNKGVYTQRGNSRTKYVNEIYIGRV